MIFYNFFGKGLNFKIEKGKINYVGHIKIFIGIHSGKQYWYYKGIEEERKPDDIYTKIQEIDETQEWLDREIVNILPVVKK